MVAVSVEAAVVLSHGRHDVHRNLDADAPGAILGSQEFSELKNIVKKVSKMKKLGDICQDLQEIIDAGVTPGFRHQPQAVKAGDMLFLSGLMAIDGDGLIEGATADPRQPFFGSSAASQAEIIIDHASRLCEAAGTTIADAVRIQQFHTHMAEFYPVYKAWEQALDGAAVPFSAVEVPSPLPVPDAILLMDIWVYCP